MTRDDVLLLCAEGDWIEVFSRGKRVAGQVLKLTDSLLLLQQPGKARPGGMTYDSIEMLQGIEEQEAVMSPAAAPAAAVVSAAPVMQPGAAAAIDTQAEIYLPDFPLLEQRELVKKQLKSQPQVSIAWSNVDAAFQDARKNHSLEFKKGNIVARLSELLRSYPQVPVLAAFGGDIYAALGLWDEAQKLYSSGQAFANAVHAAQKLSDPERVLTSLSNWLAADGDVLPDVWRAFFFYAARQRRGRMAVSCLQALRRERIPADVLRLLCFGCCHLLTAYGLKVQLPWDGQTGSWEAVETACKLLTPLTQAEPEAKKLPGAIPLLRPQEGRITYFEDAARMNGRIDGNIFFYLRQVEDAALRTFLYRNGFVRELRVTYMIAAGKTSPAADHVRLAEGEKLPPDRPEVWIHSGRIVRYGWEKTLGIVKDDKGGDFLFLLRAVIDPYLTEYLNSEETVAPLAVRYTLERRRGRQGEQLFVREMTLAEDERPALVERYQERFRQRNRVIRPELWTLHALQEEPVPDYVSLPAYNPLQLKAVLQVLEKQEKHKTAGEKAALSPAVSSAAPTHPSYTYTRLEHPYAKGMDFWQRAQNFDEAKKCFLAAVKQDDNKQKALANLLNVCLRQEGAAKEGLAYLKEFPGVLEATAETNIRIQLLDKLGEREELVAALTKGIKETFRANTKLHYIFKLAGSYRTHGDYAQALHWYEEWERVKKSSWAQLGINYGGNAKYIPMEFSVNQGMAVCAYLGGDVERAQEIARRLLQVKAENTVAQEILAGTFQLEDSTAGGMALLPDGFDFDDDDSLKLRPYEQYKIDTISLAAGIKNTAFMKGKIVNDTYEGTPAQAKVDIEHYISTMQSLPARSRSDAWAVLAKMAMQVLKAHGSDLACKENDLTPRKVKSYLGHSLLSAGDDTLLQLGVESDTARFFYNETMGLLPDRNRSRDSVLAFARFVATFFLDHDQMRQFLSETASVPDYLRLLREHSCFSERDLFYSIFMLPPKRLHDRKNELLERIEADPAWREKALKLLRVLLGDTQAAAAGPQEFFLLFVRAQRFYRGQIEKFRICLRQIQQNIKSHERFTEQIAELDSLQEQQLFFETDERRVQEIRAILVKLEQAPVKPDFYTREEDYNWVINAADRLSERIHSTPTQLSYENMLELLNFARGRAEAELNDLYESSKPQLSVEVPSSSAIVDHQLTFTLFIKNDANHQTADGIELTVRSLADDSALEKVQTGKPLLSIRGGQTAEQGYMARLQEDGISGSFDVQIDIDYTYLLRRGDTPQIGHWMKRIPISLMDRSKFVAIENVYTQLEDGNGVPPGSDLLYGRTEDIDEIVGMLRVGENELLRHRGIVLYGQKRAGKTSILNNLRADICARYGEDAYIIVESFSVGMCNGSFANFLYNLLYSLRQALKRKYRKLYEQLQAKGIAFLRPEIQDANPAALQVFQQTLGDILDAIEDCAGPDRYIPLFLIDEFTYVYSNIMQPQPGTTINGDFMKFWKGFLEGFPVCAIVVGMDSMPAFMEAFPNEFACMKAYHVSFLKEKYARDMADLPIRLPDGSSRYAGEAGEAALDYICELTAGSAYLEAIFCKALVDYLNDHCTTYVTRTVIDNLLQERLLSDARPILNQTKFDPQINDPGKFGQAEQLAVVQDNRALLSWMASCSDTRHELVAEQLEGLVLSQPEPEYRRQVLARLVDRDVVTKRAERYYKIKIDLMRRWLLREKGEEFI